MSVLHFFYLCYLKSIKLFFKPTLLNLVNLFPRQPYQPKFPGISVPLAIICGGRRFWYLAGGFLGAGPSGVSGGAICPFSILEGSRAFLVEFSSCLAPASVFGGTERGLIGGAPALLFRGCWDETDPREGAGRGGLDGTEPREGAGRVVLYSLSCASGGTEPREGAGRGGGFAHFSWLLDGTEPREGASRGLTGGATASPVGTAVATGMSLFFSSSPESFEGFGF